MRALADQPCILPISASLNTMSEDGSPLPMNWLLNFPHGHNILTHSRALSLALCVLGTFCNWIDICPFKKRMRLQVKNLTMFSNPVLYTFRTDNIEAIKKPLQIVL